jgi:hypothetical protein
MPVVHGAIRDRYCRNSGVVGPDESAATGIGSRRIAFVQLTDVARRRCAHNLLHPATLAVIDKGGVDRCTAKRGHGARHAIIHIVGCRISVETGGIRQGEPGCHCCRSCTAGKLKSETAGHPPFSSRERHRDRHFVALLVVRQTWEK